MTMSFRSRCGTRCQCSETAAERARAPWCACGELLLAPRLPPGGIDLDRWLDGLIWSMLDQALDQAGGNKAQAARLLRINRTTLIERLKRYGHPEGAA